MKMTGSKYLLDTNIISALLKGESEIADKIVKAVEVSIPSIVIGELYYGALFSTKVEKNLNDILILTSHYPVIPVDEGTCLSYGQIRSALKKRGKPLPENDIWIAAVAMQYGYTVATRDKHFNEIEGLKTKKW